MMKRIIALFVLALLLAGCESTYYDMVMDKPESGKSAKDKDSVEGKDDGWDRANDISRLRSYR